MIEWLLVLFLNSSDVGLVSCNGKPGAPCGYPSREVCEKEGSIRYVMVEMKQEPEVRTLTFICVMHRKDKS